MGFAADESTYAVADRAERVILAGASRRVSGADDGYGCDCCHSE